MDQKGEDGEARYKIEVGFSLLGEFNLELKDFGGNLTSGIGQLHQIHKCLDRVFTMAGAKKLKGPPPRGPPPRGPLERQLGRYFEKTKKGESSSGSNKKGKKK